MTHPTPKQLADFFELRNFTVINTETNYIIPTDLGPYITIPKYEELIKPKLLEKLLNKAGISIVEFEQEFKG